MYYEHEQIHYNNKTHRNNGFFLAIKILHFIVSPWVLQKNNNFTLQIKSWRTGSFEKLKIFIETSGKTQP